MIRTILGMAFAVMVAMSAAPAQAASVSTNADGTVIVLALPGDTAIVDVFVNLDTAVTFAELQLNFDPAVMSSSAVVNGGAATGGLCTGFACALNDAADNVAGFQRMGLLDISATIGFPPGPIGGGPGTHLLGVMTITAGAAGLTDVTLDSVFGENNAWTNAGLPLFQVQVGVPAPEPTALVLVGLGLAGLAGVRRRA